MSNSEDAAVRTKVFWTSEEKQRLCEEAAMLMHGLYCTRKLEALLKAQDKVLPEHRRRHVVALTTIPWFAEGLSREIEKLRATGVSPLSGKTPACAATQPGRLAVDELALDQLWSALRPRLVREAARFVSDVLQEVRWPEALTATDSTSLAQSVLQGLFHPTGDGTGEKSSRASASCPRKTAVLIVGLKGGQMEEVRRDFGRCLDLRFFGAEENKDKLKSMCESVDHAIALTGFISHAHEDIMSKRTRDYIRCSGGITRLKDMLSRLAGSMQQVQAGSAH